MDRVTLDFETGMIEWNTDNQRGTEYSPNLPKQKAAILAAMGYETVNFQPEIDMFNALINNFYRDEGK